MSADICSDVGQQIKNEAKESSENLEKVHLSTSNENNCDSNKIDGDNSYQNSVKSTTTHGSREEPLRSDPPPPLGPPRNVQGTRYPMPSQQQFAASGRTNTYSSSCDEDYGNDEAADTFIEVTISDPQKVGEGMSSYMAYRLTTKTNLKHFKHNNFSVIRRFSDFLGMHEKLTEKHAPHGRIIPPAPEKNLVGSTKVKLGQSVGVPLNPTSANIDGPENNGVNSGSPTGREFINQRRLALERFTNRVVSHPVLRRDSDVVEFLESNRDLPRATSTSALSSASVFRLLGRMGDTMNKISSIKMEETDPWYEEKTQQIDSMELQLKKLYAAAETLVQRRNELAISTGAFSQATAALSATEEAHTLSRALAHLARAEEKAEQVHHRQAEADFYHFFELIKDYVALIGAVKDTLNERNKAFQNWQHAQSMVIRKKEQKARLEMGGRMDKLPSANEEVVEWENRLEETQTHFNQISRVIKIEIELFERYRLKDFKVSIVQYMEALMACQLQLVKHWEEFLPEVKNILF